MNKKTVSDRIKKKSAASAVWLLAVCLLAALLTTGCGGGGGDSAASSASVGPATAACARDAAAAKKQARDEAEALAAQEAAEEQQRLEEEEAERQRQEEEEQQREVSAANLSLSTDYRDSFIHGEKGAAYQQYIVLHDTEGEGDASSVIDYWDSNGNCVAAHFVVNKDGTVVQCVPLDCIAHHAGFGDAGHNDMYGVSDESRDDKVGTQSIGPDMPDYGMNSYSVGIEMVHSGGEYPEAQLEALDALIAYIDDYYGFESTIIDHKAWRTGNSDTSAEFAPYLYNYQDHRTHY